MLETEIEIFRADTGASRGITASHIAEVASFDCDANPVPICFGHAKDDKPAAGVISGLRADGSRLFAKVKTFTDAAIEGIKKGEWINRSLAFFDPAHEANPTPGKWAPRHLALLGAAAPGIPGMGSLQKALSFAADGETLLVEADPAEALIFAAAPTPVRTVYDTPKEFVAMELTPEQIAENARLATERAALEADRLAFAASQRTATETANGAIVDGLVATGKVPPALAADLKLVFNALGGDVLEFSADDKTTASAKLAAILSGGVKVVPVDEKTTFVPGNTGTQFTASTGEPMAALQSDAEQIDALARKKMADRPGLNFVAAIAEVQREIAAA